MILRDYLRKAKDIVFESVAGITNDNVQDAVKTAYDKGDQALTIANSKITQTQGDARYLAKAAKAVDADKLDGKDSTSFVLTASISSAIDSASTTNVGNSNSVKLAYDKGNQALGIANGKITQAQGDARYLGINAKSKDAELLDGKDSTAFILASSISSDVDSESTTDVANSKAAKTAFDKGVEALGVANGKITQAQGDALFLGKTAKAVDADKLDGRDSTTFVYTSNISSATNSASATTVSNSLATKNTYDRATAAHTLIASKDTEYNGKFEKLASRNIVNGYAGLDSAGLLSPNQIPGQTIVNVYTYATTADRNKFTKHQKGDMAIIETTGKASLYILKEDPGGAVTVDADWLALQTNVTVDVHTWNQRNGNVMPSLGDYTTALVLHDGATLTSYLAGLEASVPTTPGDLDSYSKGESDGRFINKSVISDSVTSASTTNVSNSKASKTAYDKGVEGLSMANSKINQDTADGRYLAKAAKAADADKLDGKNSTEFVFTSNITTLTNSSSTTLVSAASATKASYDRASTALTTANGKISQEEADELYLPVAGKAVDADKLDGKDSAAFVFTSNISTVVNSSSATLVSAAVATKTAYDKGNQALTAANSKLSEATADTLYLGITAKAVDANLLDGKDSTYFLTTTGKAADADKLDGQHGSFYQSASNLTAGTIPDARLPATALRSDNRVKDLAGTLAGGAQTRIAVNYDTTGKVFNFTAALQSDNNFTSAYKSKLDNLAANKWTVITGNKTMTTGERIILDMTSTGTIVVTLPASPKAGDSVMVSDGSGLAGQGKTITVSRNNQKIMSLAEDLTFDIPGYLATLVFLNAVRGWVVMN